eukprot:12534001-Alexandrium_andersonii.AAC.1
MSASLVGSEMCIRDRCCVALRAARRPASREDASAAQASSTRPWARAPSVSYTHLTLPTICSV